MHSESLTPRLSSIHGTTISSGNGDISQLSVGPIRGFYCRSPQMRLGMEVVGRPS